MSMSPSGNMNMSTVSYLRRVSAIAVLLSSVGCAARHVQLQAPESDAPISERQTAYDNLQPISIAETHITTYRGWTPISATRRTDYLQLKGGERVYEPEDIWPVIAQTSAAANAVKNYEDKSSTVRTINWISAGLLTVGLGLTGYSVFHQGPNHSRNTTPLYLGLGFLTGGALGLFWSNRERNAANDEKSTAFETYADGLRSKLSLCVSNDRVTDCNRHESLDGEQDTGRARSADDSN